VSSAQNRNLVATVATVGGSTDGSGNPVIESQPHAGAAGRLWQLSRLGIVYLHGRRLTCG
jgi:hypothetical protein